MRGNPGMKQQEEGLSRRSETKTRKINQNRRAEEVIQSFQEEISKNVELIPQSRSKVLKVAHYHIQFMQKTNKKETTSTEMMRLKRKCSKPGGLGTSQGLSSDRTWAYHADQINWLQSLPAAKIKMKAEQRKNYTCGKKFEQVTPNTLIYYTRSVFKLKAFLVTKKAFKKKLRGRETKQAPFHWLLPQMQVNQCWAHRLPQLGIASRPPTGQREPDHCSPLPPGVCIRRKQDSGEIQPRPSVGNASVSPASSNTCTLPA